MELIKYDAMCTAIAECERVDEVKEIRDKSLALQTYFKLSKNYTAERQAIKVRIRAERRAGQLLKESDRATGQETGGKKSLGGRRERPPNQPKTLKEQGITKDESSRFQKLAEVPEALFEEKLNTPYGHPSPVAIIASHKGAKVTTPSAPVKESDIRALSMWGYFRDFKHAKVEVDEIEFLLSECTEKMRKDFVLWIPIVEAWIKEIKRTLK